MAESLIADALRKLGLPAWIHKRGNSLLPKRSILPLALAGMVISSAMVISRAAGAHPHVWIDYNVALLFDHGRITALRQHWIFDEDFSSMVENDVLKTNQPRKLGPADIAALRHNAFDNLRGYGYFTHIWANDKATDLGAIQAFDAHVDGSKLVYDVTMGLAAPLDPRSTKVTFGIWDDTYYVDLEPAKNVPVTLEGDGSAGCSARIGEDEAHPIYFGSVVPLAIRLACGGKS